MNGLSPCLACRTKATRDERCRGAEQEHRAVERYRPAAEVAYREHARNTIAPSSETPRTSIRAAGRGAPTGRNATASAISTIPIGTLTRKMPRHDQ